MSPNSSTTTVVVTPREMPFPAAQVTMGVPRYARIAPIRNGVSTGPRYRNAKKIVSAAPAIHT